jgi:hypothetical protein
MAVSKVSLTLYSSSHFSTSAATTTKAAGDTTSATLEPSETTTMIPTSETTTITHLDEIEVEPDLVLYVRDVTNADAMQTTTLMRSGFFFSTFHTLYWIWYTFDFLPIVNAASMELLHVDPMIGVAGIAIAMALQSAFVIYPRRLISKLTYRPDEQRICIYTHRLPLMYPSLYRPYTTFPVGTSHQPKIVHALSSNDNMSLAKDDIASLQAKAKVAADANEQALKKIQYFTLDTSTPVALSLIQGECEGDISKYRGHVVLGPSWPRYVLDIKASHEVKESALLLKILLSPETFRYQGRKHQNVARNTDGWQPERKMVSPFQLRIKARQRSLQHKRPGKRRR